MDISAIAVEGMHRAEAALEKTAGRLARLPLSADSADTVDLSAEVVALLAAKNAFTASARVASAASEVQASAISLLG
jgi:flagellar hook protein FlgE